MRLSSSTGLPKISTPAPRWFLALLAINAISLLPQSGAAQDKAPAAGPIVQGVVLDSEEKPLLDAEVIVTDRRNKVVARSKSTNAGRFSLALRPGDYKFAARSIGYFNGASKLIPLKAGDTLELEFVLDSMNSTMAEVRVLGNVNNPQYKITAAEIAKMGAADALDIVLRRRIRMLGDTYKGCSSDTSTFTRDFRFIRKPPKSMRDSTMPDALPFRLFINGIRHSVRSIKDVLAEIPAEDIAEMNYVDCWDKLRPNLRNSLMVVLKPGKQY